MRLKVLEKLVPAHYEFKLRQQSARHSAVRDDDERNEIGVRIDLFVAPAAVLLRQRDRRQQLLELAFGEDGARFATSLFHQPEARIPDDQYLNEWTAVLTARIQSLSGSNET